MKKIIISSLLMSTTLILNVNVYAASAEVASTPYTATSPASAVKNPKTRLISNLYTANLKKWQSQRVSDYTFTLQHNCYCLPEKMTPIMVTVKNGKVISAITESLEVAINANGSEAAPSVVDAMDQAMSVDQLFAQIKTAIDGNSAKISVKYDARWGYPKSIYIDRSEMIADEEFSLSVSGFAKIPTLAPPLPRDTTPTLAPPLPKASKTLIGG